MGVLCGRVAESIAPEHAMEVHGFLFAGLHDLTALDCDQSEGESATHELLRALESLWPRFRCFGRFPELFLLVLRIFRRYQAQEVQRRCLVLWTLQFRCLKPGRIRSFAVKLPCGLFLQKLERSSMAEPELIGLLIAIAREPTAINTLFDANLIPMILSYHPKFRYETRKQCCQLFVEISNRASDEQICKLVTWKNWTDNGG